MRSAPAVEIEPRDDLAMGNACLSKHHSMEGVAPGGRYVATAAPEPVSSGGGGGGGKNASLVNPNFVKIGRKAGVLHLNAPLPDDPATPPEVRAARQTEEEAKRAEEEKRKLEKKKAQEEQKQKQEELKRQKQEEQKKKRSEEQEELKKRKSEEQEEQKKRKLEEQEEARRRQEAEEAQRLSEASREKEEAKRRQEDQRRQEEEEKQRRQVEAVKNREEAKKRQDELKRSEEEARRRQEEIERRRKSDAARLNTYSLRQLRNSYTNDFPTFLINNTLMAVQFGAERELFEKVRAASNSDIREAEMSTRMAKTEHFKKAICPDALHEHLAQAVRFIPEEYPYVTTGVPLRPLRVMINHEDIEVTHQAESDPTPSRITKLSVEQVTTVTGFVRLLNVDPRLPKLGKLDPGVHDPEEGYPTFSDIEYTSSIPASVRVPEAISSSDSELEDQRRPSVSWNIDSTDSARRQSQRWANTQGGSSSSKGSSGYKSSSSLSVPKSNNSNSGSEHSYSTITSLHKQQLLAERRLQFRGSAYKQGLPLSCFVRKTVPSYDEESRELFKTKHYLSSTAFMDNFSAVFADTLAADLGFLRLWVDEATVCGATISVKTTSAKLEITPTVRCKAENWPSQAVEWILRKRVEVFDQRNQKLYKWPSSDVVQEVIGKGYNMVPLGYVPRKGMNPAFEREWRIEFPEAERYLETCLNDTQIRCYIFCLLLFQMYFKLEHSVTEDHLRHVLFWQAENLTLAWANYEMYNNIRAVYESLYEHLSRQELPNYFIRQRNDFLSIPRARLHAVQKRLFSFRENPFGHLVSALRRLHFPGSTLGLDLGRLMDIIKTTYTVELMNPDLKYLTQQTVQEQPTRRRNSEESNGFWADVRKFEDPKKKWRQQFYRNLEEQKKQTHKKQEQTRKLESDTARSDRPSVEVDVRKITFNVFRRQLILEFFIEHFMQLVAGVGRPRPSSELINHTNNLLLLLSDHGGADEGRLEEWRLQLQSLRVSVKERKRVARRGPLQLPPDEVSGNWTLQSVDVEPVFNKGRRLMREAPPTMVFHRLDEESEAVSASDTDL